MKKSKKRITCSLLHSEREPVQGFLSEIPSLSVFFESCRSVRRQEKKRAFGMPGKSISHTDWPGDRFYITVDNDIADTVAAGIRDSAQLNISGHGGITIQDVHVYGEEDTGAVEPIEKNRQPMAQITAILSLPNAGDQLAAVALDYGLGVPVVSLGEGTGLRDQLGLLRITIPPQKEIVHLVVSNHDCESMMQILIEHGYIDRPGGGFIYSTPVESALLDTKMVIGKQSHSASVEQIIAAIDDLKGDTEWRKRSVDLKPHKKRFLRRQQEITVYCPEGAAEEIAACAIGAGAKGATSSRVQSFLGDDDNRDTAAWERVVSLVPERMAEEAAGKIFAYGTANPGKVLSVEMQGVQAAFSHTSGRKK